MAFKLDWDRLLSSRRVRVFDEGGSQKVIMRELPESSDLRSAFERDYDRLIYSNSFRRLSRKTQVHPFSDVDYVRYRLTHSLEVSTIAVSLLRESVGFVRKQYGFVFDRYADAEWILRTAGLAHDIGNPAFGHAGEKSIQSIGEKLHKSHVTLDARGLYYRDLMFCDGNAQAFRLLSRPDLKKSFYHGLTAASLGAIIKYPYPVAKAKKSHRKMGAFESENDVLDVVLHELGLARPNGRYVRHPLSFLLEAADNICYILSDQEDAVRVGVLKEADVKKLYKQLLQLKSPMSGSVEGWRSKVADRLIRAYGKGFCSAYPDIMKGRILTEKQFLAYLPPRIVRWMEYSQQLREQIYKSNSVRHLEHVGKYALSSLLERYLPVLDSVGCAGKSIDATKRALISEFCEETFFRKNQFRNELWWGHVILDYVMGMTDDYALRSVFGKNEGLLS